MVSPRAQSVAHPPALFAEVSRTPVSRADAEPPPPTATQLVAAYAATRDFPARVEIIHQLADAGPPGLTALDQVFQIETDSTLKTTVLAVADTLDEEQLDGQLALLRHALGSDQPSEVREVALELLFPIIDPRAIPLWRMLLADADEPTREAAKEQIEQLQDLDPE